MCGFTLVHHTECGHKYISTTPEHTRLCEWATTRHFQQGFDHAPAPCTFSNDTPTRIMATCELFNHCGDCRNKLEIDPRGEDEGVLQKHAHEKEDAIGVYDQADDKELENLRDYIQEREKRGVELQKEFDAYVDTQPSGLSHPQLNVFFSQLQPAGYEGLYLNKLQACLDWFPVLEEFKKQKAPNKLFADAMLWAFSQAERVSLILDRLGDVLDCLRQFEPSRLKSGGQSSEITNIDFNGSETQLDYFVYFLILQHRGAGPELPNPEFQHFFDPTTQPSFNTLLTFRIREAANRSRNNKPIPKSVQRHNRHKAGTLNIRNLGFKLHEGLLEEEPAYNLQAEHIKVPNTNNAKRVDVVDEHGNKLVWDAHGITSKLIFAGPTLKPPQLNKQIIDLHTGARTEDQPKPQQGGYGFAYSDSDSDSEPEPEDNGALERPDLSIAGGNLDIGADKTEQLEDGAVKRGDDCPDLQREHSILSSPQRKRAPLAYVDPNRKLEALRARRPKGDIVSSSAGKQVPSLVQDDVANEDAASGGSETSTKRKQEEGHDSNGRTGGFGFAEEQPALGSSSPLPRFSGLASPALPSSAPPYEPAG